MKVLVTGSSEGIGKAIALKFLNEGHNVIGIDLNPSSINHNSYTHIQGDICDKNLLEIQGVEILINNAGVQESGKDIDVNLKGTISITEKYGIQEKIKSIVFIASASIYFQFFYEIHMIWRKKNWGNFQESEMIV